MRTSDVLNENLRGPDAEQHPTVAATVAALPPIPVLLGMSSKDDLVSSSPPPQRTESKSSPGMSRSKALVSMRTANTAGAVVRTPPGGSSHAMWKAVEDSLELPLIYRKGDDVALTLRLLRQFSVFDTLTDDELLALAGDMRIFSTRGKGVPIAEKTGAVAQVSPAADFRVPSSSDEGEDSDLQAATRRLAERADWARSSLGGNTLASSAKAPPPREASPATDHRRSLADRASCQSLASTAATSKEDYPQMPLYALAQGRALLEVPTINGKRHFPVQEGDVVGLELHWQCLPLGARYLTTEPCTWLKWTPTRGSRLARVLRRCQKYVLDAQIAFLSEKLKVPLFTPSANDQEDKREEVASVARCLLPLRLSAQQIVVEEGEAADAMFFVRDGCLAVTRTMAPTKQRNTKHSGLPSIQAHTKAHNSHTARVMEVAELHTGELFGELALLAYNPDTRPGEGVVWDGAYWRDALSQRFQVDPVDDDDEEGDASDFLRSLQRARRSTATSHGFSAACEGENAARSVVEEDGKHESARPHTDADASTVDAEVYEELRYPAQTAPRLATVYARAPSVIYYMAYTDCRRKIHGHTLTRLVELAKGYPAYGDLLEVFQKKERWAQQKKAVVQSVVHNNQNRRAKAPLAPVKH